MHNNKDVLSIMLEYEDTDLHALMCGLHSRNLPNVRARVTFYTLNELFDCNTSVDQSHYHYEPEK